MMRYGVAAGSKVYHRVVSVDWQRKRIWPGCNYQSMWYEGFRGVVYNKPPSDKRPCKRCVREKK